MPVVLSDTHNQHYLSSPLKAGWYGEGAGIYLIITLRVLYSGEWFQWQGDASNCRLVHDRDDMDTLHLPDIQIDYKLV